MTQNEVNESLKKLLEMLGYKDMKIVPDRNTRSWLTSWAIRDDESVQVGLVQARFGSEFTDEPDGFAIYMDGYRWTPFMPTIEECALAHQNSKMWA